MGEQKAHCKSALSYQDRELLYTVNAIHSEFYADTEAEQVEGKGLLPQCSNEQAFVG